MIDTGDFLRLGAALALIATAWSTAPAAAQTVDPFYAGLLEDGIRSYQRGAHAKASEELRIASFGLLDSPQELARALTHLALVQSARADVEGFVRSYRRLGDLEARFGAVSAAPLRPAVRAALVQAAVKHLPEEAPLLVGASEEDSRPRLCISWNGEGDCSAPVPAENLPALPAPQGGEEELEPERDREVRGDAKRNLATDPRE